MTDLLYKDLSYKLTGYAYSIDNQIGFGQNEKTYGDAFAKLLEKDKINFQRELYNPVSIDGVVIKKEYFDFLVDDKIIVELKVSDLNYKKACTQVFKYLKSSGIKLGLVFRFTKDGVRVKRVPNYY